MIDCSTWSLLNWKREDSFRDSCSNRFQPLSYSECEHFWSYGGKIVSLTKSILNTAVRTGQIVSIVGADVAEGMTNLASRLKLLSIINFTLSSVDLAMLVEKINESFWIDDFEGLAMGALTLVITAADAIDSITTFINAALVAGGVESIELFSSLALPLGFTMSGLGSISRIVQIAKAHHLYNSIDSAFFSEDTDVNKAAFKKSLERILGIAEQSFLIEELSSQENSSDLQERLTRLLKKKQAIISREIPKQGMELLESLFTLLDSEGEGFLEHEKEAALGYLRDIQRHLDKKMSIDAVSLVVNGLILSALFLFTAGIVTGVPFLFLSIAFAIKILILLYQESGLILTPALI